MRQIAICALLAACKPAEAPPKATDAEVAEARKTALRVQQLAEQYQIQHRKCPSGIADLIDGGMLAAPEIDRWGSEFSISCSSDGIEVVSLGPDKTLATDDDISSHQAPTNPLK